MRLLVLVLGATSLWGQSQPVFCTYLGGHEYDTINAATVDAAGYIYVAGQTYSKDFPVAGPLRTSCTLSSLGGCADAFAAKLSPDGSQLIYSIYYGTSGSDWASGIAVGSDGAAWIAGTIAGGILLVKLSPEGRPQIVRNIPVYPLAWAHAIALDRHGNVYITGETTGPVPLAHPLQEQMGAPSCTAAGAVSANPLDAFVMKFSPAGELLYSTYLGGSGNDSGLAIALDQAGNIYVAGNTSSRDLTLVNPSQTAYSGGEPTGPGQCEGGDGFIAKIDASGSRIVYSTYSGTPGREAIAAIHVSPEGYLTASRNGPSSALQTFSPEGALLWERPGPGSQSLVRNRAGSIFLAVPGGYVQFDSAGLDPQAPTWGPPFQTTAVQVQPDGAVLFAGMAQGPGMLVVNPVQPVFGGVFDGALALARPPNPDCSLAIAVNGASMRGPYLAPESIASLFGCRLDGANRVVVMDETGNPAEATILAATATQVNLVLPRGLASGRATLTALRGDLFLARASAYIERTAPALFTASASGEGAPAAVVLRVTPDGTQSAAPAAACDESGCEPVPIDLGGPQDRTYLLLFGTGIRFGHPAELSVRANGVEMPIAGYAAQSEYRGLDQVNVELPRTFSGTGRVELELAIGEILANPVVVLVR